MFSLRHTHSSVLLERLARGLVYAITFVSPLFFLPFTLDPLELNKQTILVFLTLSALLAWLGSMHASRTIAFRRGWLNVIPLLLLVAAGVSASVSHAPYLSWIGDVSQQYTSALSFLCYAAVFFLGINLFDKPSEQAKLYTTLMGSAFIAGIIGLLSLCGLAIPTLVMRGSYNTLGTVNALAVFLAAVTVLANARWIAEHDRRSAFVLADRVLTFLLSIVTLVTLILLDFWVLWVVFLAGLASIFVFVLLRASDVPDVGRLTLPSFLAAFSLLFLLWLPSPFRANIPLEVVPSFSGSWKVMSQSLPGHWLFGTGPGTFSFDFGKFKQPELNSTSFWNVRFDRPASFLLLLPATLGLFGLLGWLVLVLPLLVVGIQRIIRAKGNDWLPAFVAFSGWFTLLVATFLYSADVAILTGFFLLSGLLASLLMRDADPRPFGQSPRLGLALSFAFILVSVGAVTLIFVTGQRYAAEISFAKAVEMDRAKGDLNTIVTKLDYAATINRFDDIYYRNLAQALLLKVGNEINNIKDPQSLKPADRQRIQALTAASVNAAVRATDLSNENALNWIERGNVYRQLVPVVGGSAGDLSVQAFQRSIELEPTNPESITNLGLAYMAVAEYNRPLAASKDSAVAKDAQQKVDTNLKLAEDQFNKAIKLKSDYSPAHYQLAVILESQGQLDDAIAKMETVSQYNQQDVGVAFQLGLLYLRRGGKDDLVRAQAALEYAVQLLPSYSNARWFLASIYEQQNKIDKAIEQIQKVAELNPGNELIAARLDRLKKGTTTKDLPPTLESGDSTATSVPDGQPTTKKGK